jgi:uncharacterized protein YijF (DUF1287 family)
MKRIRQVGSFAGCAAIAVVLSACSGNPVEEENLVVGAKKSTPVSTTSKSAALSSKQAAEKKLAIAALGKTKVAAKQASFGGATQAKPVVVAKASAPKTVVRTPAKRVVAKAPVKRVIKRAPTVVAKRAPAVRVATRAVPAPVIKRAAVVRPTVRPMLASNNRAAKPRIQKAIQKSRVQRIDPNSSFGYALSNAAIERTRHNVRYDGKYLKIGYPWGDVPKSIGVCTDVVIRSYRKLGIDLQQEVHKDIKSDFYAYPNLTKWGLERPDPNIDHRRVYNLQAFFKRHKAELPRSRNPRDYKPGDLVTWMVGPQFPHIGVVVNVPSKADPNRLMISHNIGRGPQIEDILFSFPMTGHYRYTPKHRTVNPAQHFAKTPPPASVRKKQQSNAATYAQLVEASKYLIGKPAPKAKATAAKPPLIQATAKTARPIQLAQLDAALLLMGK